MAIPLRIQNDHAKPKLQVNVPSIRKRDWRLWLGVLFVVFSILATARLISAASARVEAVMVVRDVAAGSTLTESDLALVRVALPTELPFARSLSEVVGLRATRNLYANDIVQSTAVGESLPKEFRNVSVPIRAGHLPSLMSGSAVDVWLTPSTQGMALPGPPSLVISHAVVETPPDAVDSATDTAVTLLIPNEQVPKLMTAIRDGSIDLAAVPQSEMIP